MVGWEKKMKVVPSNFMEFWGNKLIKKSNAFASHLGWNQFIE